MMGRTVPERAGLETSSAASGAAAIPGVGARPRGGADPVPTVVHVMTIARTTGFLRGQASFVREAGYALHVITSPGPELDAFGRDEGVAVHAVPMTRQISPVADLVSLFRLWRLLRAIRPEIVHTHTPKGGMLGLVAAWLAGAPVRVYHLRGLRFETAVGWRLVLLRGTERVACTLAHRVIAISQSLRTAAIREGLCPPDRITVLGSGSGNGVDTARYHPLDPEVGRAARARLGIPADAKVIGFVGRIAHDKGIGELAAAWGRLREEDPGVHLLVVGPEDEDDPVAPEVVEALRRDPRVHLTGMDRNTPPLYAAMDVLAFPTYREGFGNVSLEAAAMGLPVVATRVSGCLDAVQDGRTGTLVPARDADALRAALAAYLRDPALRARHGAEGLRRARTEFEPRRIWEGILGEYEALLGARRPAATTH